MQAGCPPLPCSPWRSHAHVCPQGYIRIVLEAAERDAASGCARGCDAFACEPDLGSALGFGPTVETVEPRPCGAFDDEPGRQTCRADADGCVGNWSLAVVDCGVPLPCAPVEGCPSAGPPAGYRAVMLPATPRGCPAGCAAFERLPERMYTAALGVAPERQTPLPPQGFRAVVHIAVTWVEGSRGSRSMVAGAAAVIAGDSATASARRVVASDAQDTYEVTIETQAVAGDSGSSLASRTAVASAEALADAIELGSFASSLGARRAALRSVRVAALPHAATPWVVVLVVTAVALAVTFLALASLAHKRWRRDKRERMLSDVAGVRSTSNPLAKPIAATGRASAARSSASQAPPGRVTWDANPLTDPLVIDTASGAAEVYEAARPSSSPPLPPSKLTQSGAVALSWDENPLASGQAMDGCSPSVAKVTSETAGALSGPLNAVAAEAPSTAGSSAASAPQYEVSTIVAMNPLAMGAGTEYSEPASNSGPLNLEAATSDTMNSEHVLQANPLALAEAAPRPTVVVHSDNPIFRYEQEPRV